MSDKTRYGVMSLHMTVSEFEITFYDRRTGIEHVSSGFTSMMDPEIWNVLNPAFDEMITSLRERSTLTVQALGEPYPEAQVDQHE
jgi:hypothetical protein